MAQIHPNSLRRQTYSDIIVTAVEGGIGYWSQCRNYRWQDDNGEEIPATVEVRECEEDGVPCGDWIKVTPDTIASALSRMSRGEGFSGNPKRPAPEWWTRKWRKAYRDCATGDFDFDASDADTIFQVAALGVLTYG